MEKIIIVILVLIILYVLLSPTSDKKKVNTWTYKKIEEQVEKEKPVEVDKSPKEVHINSADTQYLKVRYGILLDGDNKPYTYFEYYFEAFNYARLYIPHKKWKVVTCVDYIEKV